MVSTASWERRDLIERFGRGRIRRSGKVLDGVSGDERYDVPSAGAEVLTFFGFHPSSQPNPV